MTAPADFEWDDAKAESNLAKHGISFDEAVAAFFDPRLLSLDASRPTDGEERIRALGMIEGRLFSVVCTLRGDILRLISARRANAVETRAYDGNR